MEKKYIITTKENHYVGLFYWGKTYKVAFTKRIIKCTEETAQILANTFGGTYTEVK